MADKSSTSGDETKKVEQSAQPTLDERMKQYAELVATQKQQMAERLDKNQLIDIIFKQNTVITQQSNQMIDLVNIVNDMESQVEAAEVESENSVDQNTVQILKNRNELCRESDELRRRGSHLYESSVKIQFVLFVLFILVLFWLIYHFSTFGDE